MIFQKCYQRFVNLADVFVVHIVSNHLEAYPGPCQISKMNIFAKTFTEF